MLTEIKTSKGSRFLCTFPPDSCELAGQQYFLGLLFCNNPVCNCTTGHVSLFSETSDLDADSDQAEQLQPSFKFDIDIRSRALNTEDSRQTGMAQQIDTAFVNALSEDDWQLLTRAFYAYKRLSTDETPDDEIMADFPADDIEQNSSMISFNSILPYAEHKTIEIESRQLFIHDLYCVKPNCTCTDIVLDLQVLNTASEMVEPVTEGPVFFYNYRTKSWKIEREGDEDPQFFHRIAKELKVDDFTSFFEGRHARLRALYRDYQARNPRHAAKIPARPAVGRNDPCPCGSGKKYKKCCLDTSLASWRA